MCNVAPCCHGNAYLEKVIFGNVNVSSGLSMNSILSLFSPPFHVPDDVFYTHRQNVNPRTVLPEYRGG